MHQSLPMYAAQFNLDDMLDPVECTLTPKLAYATPTICSPLPMKPHALQWHGAEPPRSPSPLSPVSPTSASSGRSSPSTDPDGDLLTPLTLQDNASHAGTSEGATHLRHTDTETPPPPPQQMRSTIHATIRRVPEHARKCCFRSSCCGSMASTINPRYIRAAPYPSVYAHPCECVVYETPRSKKAPRADMPSVTESLQGISLGDGLTPQHLESLRSDEPAQLLSDTAICEKRMVLRMDVECKDPPRSIEPVEQECPDNEDGTIVYDTSGNGSSHSQAQDEDTHCLKHLLLTPLERKALLEIHDFEWDELLQDIAAATALPLRRRLRPGERNAPLVPSPLSIDPDCADEIVDTAPPTYAKGVWPSYRRTIPLVEVEPYRDACIGGGCGPCWRCRDHSEAYHQIYRDWLCYGESELDASRMAEAVEETETEQHSPWQWGQ